VEDLGGRRAGTPGCHLRRASLLIAGLFAIVALAVGLAAGRGGSAQGTGQTRLTNNPHGSFEPAWFP